MVRMTRFFLMSSVAISTLMTIATILSYLFLLPDIIPLWYSLARMQDQLAPREWVFILPALGWGFTILSAMIASRKELDETATVLHNLGNSIVMIMLSASLIRVLFLVLP